METEIELATRHIESLSLQYDCDANFVKEAIAGDRNCVKAMNIRTSAIAALAADLEALSHKRHEKKEELYSEMRKVADGLGIVWSRGQDEDEVFFTINEVYTGLSEVDRKEFAAEVAAVNDECKCPIRLRENTDEIYKKYRDKVYNNR